MPRNGLRVFHRFGTGLLKIAQAVAVDEMPPDCAVAHGAMPAAVIEYLTARQVSRDARGVRVPVIVVVSMTMAA